MPRTTRRTQVDANSSVISTDIVAESVGELTSRYSLRDRTKLKSTSQLTFTPIRRTAKNKTTTEPHPQPRPSTTVDIENEFIDETDNITLPEVTMNVDSSLRHSERINKVGSTPVAMETVEDPSSGNEAADSDDMVAMETVGHSSIIDDAGSSPVR